MDKLLLEQEEAMKAVARALPNVKKLGQNNYTVAKLQSRLSTLKENFNRCVQLHNRLRSYEETAKIEEISYFRDNLFLACEECFDQTCDYINEQLHLLQPTQSSSPLQSSGDQPSGIAASFGSHHPTFQLPQIHLPTFSGDLKEWESFRDKFKALIINERSLSDVSRLHYLGSCLKGEAHNLIQHLPVTDADFKIAWNLVSSRYENTRCLISAHLKTLYSLPQLNSDSVVELKNLRDKANSAIQALRNLKQPIAEWDAVLVFFVAIKLDKATRQAWELKLGDSVEYPSYSTLDQFLASRTRALEVIQTAVKTKVSRTVMSHSATSTPLTCPLCRSEHQLFTCPTFKSKSVADRFEYIKTTHRCINCLSAKHPVTKCASKHTCQQCKRKHHTLLHFPATATNNETATSSRDIAPSSSNISSHVISKTILPQSKILLATAWVQVSSSSGRRERVRALLDQGSVTTLITENLAQLLRLSRRRVSVSITGIGDIASSSRHAVTIQIAPTHGRGPSFATTALVLKTLTRYVPERNENPVSWSHLKDVTFADEDPMSAHLIDIIIGADLYGFVLLDGIRSGALNEPIAQNSIFGWILSGPVSSRGSRLSSSILALHCASFDQLALDIRRFWETEELPQKTHLTPEEQACEDHFLATHSRDATGRYIVRLPFKGTTPPNFGESKTLATSMLLRQEKRLQKCPDQQAEYNEFLAEYLRLGHMKSVLPSVSDRSPIVYIPHHAVVRESSTTTRLRVVFNASSRTSNGFSLNDHLLIGPKLQTDLPSVILRWRQYRYVLSADIAKMYRQILVDTRDVDYQRILWRPSTSSDIEEFQLLTVTYGTTPAPFLALRVLQQLAKDEGSRFPLAIPILRQNIYVDDCIFGADDKNSALETRDQLIGLLQKGHFQLRKWASNSASLLSDIPSADHGLACEKPLQIDEGVKVLGIMWNPETDCFRFNVTPSPLSSHTKRTILSTIARLFDPLGWVTPVTVTAKILLQQLWLNKCDWDAPLPPEIKDRWCDYYTQLPSLANFQISRWTQQGSQILDCELHGFADASSLAYAAVIYLRVMTSSGQYDISLLTAKSKVAPVKPLTIPRLELSAAVLLSRLMNFVRTTLNLQTSRYYCWTDSTITLCWLSQSPARWKTFIANRVAEIQTLGPDAIWRYVPTNENPADCASRGLSSAQLLDHTLWWNDPSWLHQSPDHWPSQTIQSPIDAPLEERTNVSVHLIPSLVSWDLSQRYSSWPKLLRVTAYIMRFVRRLRILVHERQLSKLESPAFSLVPPALSPSEIESAKFFWIRYAQQELFSPELQCLADKRPISTRSSLVSLNPFLDENGIIRVGGRLKNAKLPDQEKHPIVLKSHPLVTLIISHAHLRTLHAGPHLTLCILRQEYWILRGRPTVRSVIYRCVTCARERASLPQQLMGNLPDVRVNRSIRAFVHCGIDYAGPILVRTSSGRGHKSHKAYIALFICLVVKAVHLELVTDYSTAAFLAAYNRFCSRRGLPTNVYTDNGTTFQGANRELDAAFRSATRDPTLLNKLAVDRVNWHFIPPSAPHFGGLWEAGVRSVKFHVKRVVGDHTLTYEEFSTLLCQVEACLNSRPIAPLSENFDDYSALTPGHFLIGSALTTVPAPSLLELKESRLSRWQLVQQMFESFWRRWSQDYMQGLQQRVKWRRSNTNVTRGQLVLIRNSNVPPCKWELGRITECHPGTDGLVRVVTVKTATSEYKRPIVKLCVLPINSSEEPNSSRSDNPKVNRNDEQSA